MDKIYIVGATFEACHGVHPEEKTEKQPFIVDAVLQGDFSKGAKTDDLKDTVSYGDAFRMIEKCVTENSFDLIERLCDEIISRLFDALEKVDIIKITVKKPNAPIKGKFDYVAVEMERNRNDR